MARLENQELREYAKENKVFLWQIANELNIAEATLMRWLRFPLPDDKKAAFIKAVDSIAGRKGGDHIAEEEQIAVEELKGTTFPKRKELLRKSDVLDAIMNGLMNWDKAGEFNEYLYGEIVNEINELEVFT